MEAQWKVRLLLAQAQPRTLLRRLTIPAQARLPEGAEAEVAPMVAGRLLAPAKGRMPVSGERVEAGQELASVEPALGAADLAQLQALALEFDLKALEVERASSDAAARLEFAVRDLERIRRLRESGLSTQQQLDEAERDLALAQTESESARSTKAALDRLVAQRAARGAEGGLLSMRFPLPAPLRGILVAGGRVEGESVDPDDVLFRILDSSRIWVEGRASEFDLPLVEGAVAATATFVAIPGARFEAGKTGTGRPIWIGPIVDAATRTALVRCELDNQDGRIRAGMLAEIELGVERVEAAVSIPADAVVMDQGLPTAYVMLDGEMFQKRDLELGIRDGSMVEVRRGGGAGERIATRGAYVVKLAAFSPASFGAGHQH
jgi:RND family efflux transporter MFP subunit